MNQGHFIHSPYSSYFFKYKYSVYKELHNFCFFNDFNDFWAKNGRGFSKNFRQRRICNDEYPLKDLSDIQVLNLQERLLK